MEPAFTWSLSLAQEVPEKVSSLDHSIVHLYNTPPFYSWKCAEKHATTFGVLQDALCLQHSLVFVSGHAYLILLENQSVGCAISPTPLQEDPLVVVSVSVLEWIDNSRDTHHTA